MPVSCALKLVMSLLFGCTVVDALDQGPIVIKQDGQILNLRVAATEAGLVTSSSDGSSITMKWGGEVRAFVVKEEMADMPASNFHSLTLLNRELSYDIDLSTVGCSCNAALFFVSSLGYGSNGSIARGDNAPYYCDANDVGGVWCWEMDAIESNKWAMQTTPHTCNAPAGGYISSCDRAGCNGDRTSLNSFHVDPDAMCPDSHCKVDTRRPFRIHQRYETDSLSTTLIGITNRVVQGSNAFEWSVCPDLVYLEQMSGALASSMKMVFQLWGESREVMSWLDGKIPVGPALDPLCNDACNQADATVTFSNIEIRKLDKPAAVLLSSNIGLATGMSMLSLSLVFGALVSFVRRGMSSESLAEPLIPH